MPKIPDPVGRVVRDVAMVRGEFRTALIKLPTTDPLRPLLDQIDNILAGAEKNITKVTEKITTQTGLGLLPGITGPASLKRWVGRK